MLGLNRSTMKLLVDSARVGFNDDYLEGPLNDLPRTMMLIWVMEEVVAIKTR